MSHPTLPPLKTAIILTNLGTPSAPTTKAVKTYLREFLSDRRVVELPPLLWQLILRLLVLPFRSGKSAKLYKKIWQAGGSPLLTHSQALAEQLNTCVQQTHPDAQVFLAMRYGEPSLKTLLATLKNVPRLIIVPMYPQYASATTGSTLELIYRTLATQRYLPSLHALNSYHDHPAYIQALADSVSEAWAKNGKSLLVISFHGIPKRSLTLGDPYYCLCQKTGRLLAEALNLSATDYRIVFQSRFGKAAWLQPYCDKTLEALPLEGIKKVSVICPGFAVDCLETLEEMDLQNRNLFLKGGGTDFTYIPCLNASAAQVALYMQLILNLTVGQQ